jgi:WD40 repeat protein
MGAKPIIYQWSREGSMIQQFKGAKKGVSAVAANEQFLIAAGLDDNHYVYLFSVGSGKLLGSEKGGRDVIIDMKWVDEDNFISIGVKHYKYWTVNGKSMKGKSGLFGKNCNILCCLEVREGKAYVGASDGSLQIWSGNSCEKRIKAHDKKAIHAICLTRNVILTGSSDETVKLFTIDSHELITIIKCQNLISNSHHLSIRAIDVF